MSHIESWVIHKNKQQKFLHHNEMRQARQIVNYFNKYLVNQLETRNA